MRRRKHDGDEQAACTPERRGLNWKPGERKAIKTRSNRRERQAGRQNPED